MKTKEEILEETFDSKGLDLREITSKTENAILVSIDEYSKRIAIEFLDWCSDNYNFNGRKGCWDSKKLNNKLESVSLVDSTEELFSVFKKHLNE